MKFGGPKQQQVRQSKQGRDCLVLAQGYRPNSFKIGIVWSNVFAPVLMQAAKFKTSWEYQVAMLCFKMPDHRHE